MGNIRGKETEELRGGLWGGGEISGPQGCPGKEKKAVFNNQGPITPGRREKKLEDLNKWIETRGGGPRLDCLTGRRKNTEKKDAGQRLKNIERRPKRKERRAKKETYRRRGGKLQHEGNCRDQLRKTSGQGGGNPQGGEGRGGESKPGRRKAHRTPDSALGGWQQPASLVKSTGVHHFVTARVTSEENQDSGGRNRSRMNRPGALLQ